jgi:arabinofuranosyltransferase
MTESEVVDKRENRLLLLLVASVTYVSVLRFGWVSDDGFITARSLEQLASGRGLTINTGVRVQAFTSPLWMIIALPLHLITRSPYLSLIVPGLVASLALIVCIVRQQGVSFVAKVLILLALAASPAFLAYSTSGLENSLAHLLAFLLYGRLIKDRAETDRSIYFLGALLVLTRFDYVLLLLPALAYGALRDGRAALRALPYLLVPLGLWGLFALVYYGFLLPNTAYAKLNGAVPWTERVLQGFAYVIDLTYRDAWTAVGTFGALLIGLSGRSRRHIFAGCALYLGYIVWIGGDFMSGRFFTVPFLLGVLYLGERIDAVPRGWAAGVLATLTLFIILAFQDRRAHRSRTECYPPPSGVADERECYVEHTGLSQNIRVQHWKQHGYLADYRAALGKAQGGVIVFNLIGMATWGSKEDVHILEGYALSDPLLARLTVSPDGKWRPGHLPRTLPAGYFESIAFDTNEIVDPCARALYEDLRLITSGPIFSAERFGAILRRNLGPQTCPAP